MKIAITGHTKGIGKACADLFNHHTIYGYTRSNGYDISDPEKIFKNAEECDVFINNAYWRKYQVDLFKLFYNSWEHTNKHIINVNTIVKYPREVPILERYKSDKIALQNAVDEVYLGPKGHGTCKVTNINPGRVATGQVENYEYITSYNWEKGGEFTTHDPKPPYPSLDPVEVAKVIKWCVEQDFNIYDITLSR